jgi:hypothetical protein
MVDLSAQITAALKAERIRIARLGGLGRKDALSPAQRKKIATKASRAAAKVRKQRAKQRKQLDSRSATRIAMKTVEQEKAKEQPTFDHGSVRARLMEAERKRLKGLWTRTPNS